LNLYRCQFWETPMCKIYEFDQSKLIRDGCTRCMIDCYRDASVMQFVAISAGDAYTNLKRGKLIAATKNIFDRRNLTSLKAVWEDRKWIGDVCGSARTDNGNSRPKCMTVNGGAKAQ
jgi:hypothetical protein